MGNRYTVTYTPSDDRILPSPSQLHVKIRNNTPIPFRAAYLHGPYTLHVATYPSTFNPNKKIESPKRDGVPEFEPNLKAGGSWHSKLTVPEDIRESGDRTLSGEGPKSATWIIEITSQILFSASASVSYELLVARDEKSLDLGFTAITGNTQGSPGQVQDHQQGKSSHTSRHAAQPKGVYSKAVKLVVDDTTSLWNTPALPEWKHEENEAPRRKSRDSQQEQPEQNKIQKKVHLVVLTHGLHSNVSADMLYMKESIDATVRQAREDRRRRRREDRAKTSGEKKAKDASTAPLSGGQEEIALDTEDEDEEQVVVRGFDGNVIRTERGIQYLGKRLAKHILRETYPDQPFLPVKKTMGQKMKEPFVPAKSKPDPGIPAHDGSSIHRPHIHHTHHEKKRAYKYTSISFIGHSLGGLVQTYAIAYIHKHSPQFFELIKPINFIALASPFLGLSNENPMYVKFALDFGLVGRTGQDLGLTWRAPTLAKNGWTAMVGGLGGQSQKDNNTPDPGAKPLLRILPSGPAHTVLRMFRNRTVYSNVVNDGIVPLRTSCLLFLDWRGLGRVQKARRENGLVGTVAEWGWSQITGQNTSPNPSRLALSGEQADRDESPTFFGDDTTVPQPGLDVVNEDEESRMAAEPSAHQFLEGQKLDADGNPVHPPNSSHNQSTLMNWWSYIRPSGKHTAKDKKMFKRSQTLRVAEGQNEDSSNASTAQSTDQPRRARATRGDSLDGHPSAPPKTTIFESAGDLLAPPVPPASWIADPSSRARTIFHDRIYHPEDIPPPPAKRPKLGRSFSSENSAHSQATVQGSDDGGMRVEEKIARAYHKDLSWRKVLVRLEPDAHNNIIVRRMFANAYGWPVVKHLCDTHFADTFAAETRDENEPGNDRAKAMEAPVHADGEHVKGQTSHSPPATSETELREVADELTPLSSSTHIQQHGQDRDRGSVRTTQSLRSKDSAQWDDTYFEGSSDSDSSPDDRTVFQKFLQPAPTSSKSSKNKTTYRSASAGSPTSPLGFGTSEAEISEFLSAGRPVDVDVHRGLGTSPRPRQHERKREESPAREPDSLESMGGDRTPSPPTLTHTGSGSMLDIGLRRSLDVSPAGVGAGEGAQQGRVDGVAEQIARMTLGKGAEVGKEGEGLETKV